MKPSYSSRYAMLPTHTSRCSMWAVSRYVSPYPPVWPTGNDSVCEAMVARLRKAVRAATSTSPSTYCPMTRSGNALHRTTAIPLTTAVLGGEAIIDTLEGSVRVKIAPGTQPGTQLRLRGKGFPVYKREGSYGDLIVTFRVAIPTSLTPHQRKLYEELQREER